MAITKGNMMNNPTQLMSLALLALGASMAYAENIIPGPKGGKLLENEAVRAEFLVEKDRTVTINFYNANLKSVAVSNQKVTAIAEVKDSKIKIEFQKKGDSLASTSPLPEGKDYNVVVQLKNAPDAKVKNFRIPLNLEGCGECKRAEYACICEGH